METSIKIKDETKRKLNLLKYENELKSLDDVIKILLKKEEKENEKQNTKTDEEVSLSQVSQ